MPAHLELDDATSEAANAILNEGLAALQDALRALLGGARPDPAAPPPGFAPAMARWWGAYDRYTALIAEALGARCGGCWACCRDNPRGVSGVEIYAAAEALRALPDAAALRADVAEAAVDWRARVARAGPDAAAAEVALGGPWCPMLSADGRCRIYDSRPIACRMFLSITDPDWCDHAHPEHDRAVNPHAEPARVLRQLLAAISERLGLAGLPRDLRSGLDAALGG